MGKKEAVQWCKGAVVACSLVSTGMFATGVAVANSASATSLASCTPAQMKVSLGESDGAAGTIYYPIIFTNTGARCATLGLPSVQPVTGAKHVRVGPAATVPETFAAVAHSIAKGHSISTAYGVTESGNYPPAACGARKATGIVVRFGHYIHPTYIALAISVCTKRASTETHLLVNGVTGE